MIYVHCSNIVDLSAKRNPPPPSDTPAELGAVGGAEAPFPSSPSTNPVPTPREYQLGAEGKTSNAVPSKEVDSAFASPEDPPPKPPIRTHRPLSAYGKYHADNMKNINRESKPPDQPPL